MTFQQALLNELSSLEHAQEARKVDFSKDYLEYRFQCATPAATTRLNELWDAIKVCRPRWLAACRSCRTHHIGLPANRARATRASESRHSQVALAPPYGRACGRSEGGALFGARFNFTFHACTHVLLRLCCWLLLLLAEGESDSCRNQWTRRGRQVRHNLWRCHHGSDPSRSAVIFICFGDTPSAWCV